MRVKTILVGAAVASLASAPVLAQADRTAAPVGDASALGYPESATQLIVLALVAAAIIAGIVLTDNDDDEATSP